MKVLAPAFKKEAEDEGKAIEEYVIPTFTLQHYLEELLLKNTDLLEDQIYHSNLPLGAINSSQEILVELRQFNAIKAKDVLGKKLSGIKGLKRDFEIVKAVGKIVLNRVPFSLEFEKKIFKKIKPENPFLVISEDEDDKRKIKKIIKRRMKNFS